MRDPEAVKAEIRALVAAEQRHEQGARKHTRYPMELLREHLRRQREFLRAELCFVERRAEGRD